MRITHRMIANNVNYNLQRSLRSLEQYSNQLSTGKLFHRPSENPVGVGRVMGYSAAINRNEQFRLNMNQGSGWLENTEGGLLNGLDVLQRVRELAVYGANESLTAEDRRAIAPEVLEFIDHLIGIANTEVAGLYIFGGHQTLKTPFIREKVYDLVMNHLKEHHAGHAEFNAGAVQAGTADREIGLTFTIDDEVYKVKAFSGGVDTDLTFDNIKQAIESHPKLGKHIAVQDDAGEMVFQRVTPGDFSVVATTAEAEAVIADLDLDTVVNALASDFNISSVSGISANSFLTGEYKIFTEDTSLPYGADEATKVFQYSQSYETLVSDVTTAPDTNNQSLSMVVTGIEYDNDNNPINVTFSYETLQMDSANGNTGSALGSFRIEMSDPATYIQTVGSVTVDFNNVQFNLGDKVVINTNADIAADADLVSLHREGDTESLFTYAFNNNALVDPLVDSTHTFSFFSLDEKSGALLKSSMDLTWTAGANFETEDDPASPAAGFLILDELRGGVPYDIKDRVIAEGLQNGTYSLEETRYTPHTDISAGAKLVQQYLQNDGGSIFTGAAPGEMVSMDIIGGNNLNASIQLEVREINLSTGEVRFEYNSHQYDLDGNYSNHAGSVTLVFGGDASQPVNIGGVQIDFSGLDQLKPEDARALTKGDRAVIGVTPEVASGTAYDRLVVSGDYRGGSSETTYIFNDAFNGDLRFFSLDTFRRSIDNGKAYNGFIRVDAQTLELLRLPGNQTFNYDRNGFPVYYGDNQDRVQEISPFQEIIMNLTGLKSFGMEQEVFEAVFDVYWALIDNDREALGGEALQKMDAAVDFFLENLAQVGARSNRVDAMKNTLSNENLHLREVRSNIEDIDLAQVITEFMMQENAYKAALSTASMMLQPSLVDYMR